MTDYPSLPNLLLLIAVAERLQTLARVPPRGPHALPKRRDKPREFLVFQPISFAERLNPSEPFPIVVRLMVSSAAHPPPLAANGSANETPQVVRA